MSPAPSSGAINFKILPYIVQTITHAPKDVKKKSSAASGRVAFMTLLEKAPTLLVQYYSPIALLFSHLEV